ncbi:VanZ family protein [Luteimonas composti]|uniref:VanZ family protein n=1 Tax=Luteimonas composti TaxID=398257 RepID=A0ABT6MVB9_9GAMM|nr:VanZ family protein [Luteimonas composti]MDH7454596.1 VanZ family protein [Luteimonas composti]
MSGRPRYRPGRSLKPLRHPRFWVALWTLAIAGVVVLSMMPPPPMPDFDGSDKWSHFLGYFALAASAVQLFRNWPALLGAGLGLVLLGIGIEYAQGALTVDRMADTRDALANTLGVIAGLGTRLTPLRDLLLRIDGWRGEPRA